jgi:LacI family transcriptional regulator
MPRATRQDVATLAGVSTTVVSYVVNGGPRPVADTTRARVLAAMDELNYRPNAHARALKLKRTNVLGLMMMDITNPYYSEFARIFQDLAYEAGYAVIIANTGQDGTRKTAEVQSLLAREVDGIVAYGVRREETLEILVSSGTRIVSMDWHLVREEIPSVGIDDYGATRSAIEHLQSHGHHRIGFVGGIDDPTMREQAWRDAVYPEFGDSLDEFAEWGEFSRGGGYLAAMRLLDRPDRPSAVFISADVQAFGALRAAQVLHINVPNDLAVISFDCTEASRFTSPPLTAIRVPFELIAKHCLRKLIDPIGGFELHTTVPHQLEIRSSCGCEHQF